MDLYYNFQHATGRNVVSLPPTSLMELVSWNVCPKVAPHGKDCLFEEDQKFTTLRGSVSHALGQVPPGMYELVIKRDYFNKVRGAVRNVEQLESFARRFVKVDVALDAAAAGWHFEAEELLVRCTMRNRHRTTCKAPAVAVPCKIDAESVYHVTKTAARICRLRNPWRRLLWQTALSSKSRRSTHLAGRRWRLEGRILQSLHLLMSTMRQLDDSTTLRQL